MTMPDDICREVRIILVCFGRSVNSRLQDIFRRAGHIIRFSAVVMWGARRMCGAGIVRNACS